jgi:NADH-quinone oxidoreductase subunit F
MLNTEVGKDIDFKTLRDTYDAIYIATGTQFPQKVNIPGENLPGVVPGIEFLKNVKLYNSVDLQGRR